MTLPSPVEVRLDDSVKDYWLDAAQHSHDSYAPPAKFPQDLRVYEHLLWESRADVASRARRLPGRERALASVTA